MAAAVIPQWEASSTVPWAVSKVPRLPSAFTIAPFQAEELRFENRVFRFVTPIKIEVEHRNGLWVHECESLGISAFGLTHRESEVSFCMDFAALWDEIAQEDERNLAPNALELKHQLLKLIAAVE
jgi:hypothetical protein